MGNPPRPVRKETWRNWEHSFRVALILYLHVIIQKFMNKTNRGSKHKNLQCSATDSQLQQYNTKHSAVWGGTRKTQGECHRECKMGEIILKYLGEFSWVLGVLSWASQVLRWVAERLFVVLLGLFVHTLSLHSLARDAVVLEVLVSLLTWLLLAERLQMWSCLRYTKHSKCKRNILAFRT